VKNPWIDKKDCIIILIGFCLGMIGVVDVVDCALMSFVMDCIPSTIGCVVNTNAYWSNGY
jgi:hypothetical protein